MLLALSAALLATLGMVWIYQNHKAEIQKVPTLPDLMKQLDIQLPEASTASTDPKRDSRKIGKKTKNSQAPFKKIVKDLGKSGAAQQGGISILPDVTTRMTVNLPPVPSIYMSPNISQGVKKPLDLRKLSATQKSPSVSISLPLNVKLSTGASTPTLVTMLKPSGTSSKPLRAQTLSGMTSYLSSSVSLPQPNVSVPPSEFILSGVSMSQDVKISPNMPPLRAVKEKLEEKKFSVRHSNDSTSSFKKLNSTLSI